MNVLIRITIFILTFLLTRSVVEMAAADCVRSSDMHVDFVIVCESTEIKMPIFTVFFINKKTRAQENISSLWNFIALLAMVDRYEMCSIT